MALQRLAYTVEEVADLLGIRPEYVRSLVRTGRLPGVKLGRRVLIPVKALRDVLAFERHEEAA
jgi:excisionase family DNA binding protein